MQLFFASHLKLLLLLVRESTVELVQIHSKFPAFRLQLPTFAAFFHPPIAESPLDHSVASTDFDPLLSLSLSLS
jgi:hypothetical protein